MKQMLLKLQQVMKTKYYVFVLIWFRFTIKQKVYTYDSTYSGSYNLSQWQCKSVGVL